MKRGKKYVEAAKAVDRATLYDTNEAISLCLGGAAVGVAHRQTQQGGSVSVGVLQHQIHA